MAIIDSLSLYAKFTSSPRFYLPSCSVIDLLRLVLASNPAAFKATPDKGAVVDALLVTIEKDTPWETPLPKARETNLLLVLRTIANMFQTTSGPVPAPWTSKVRLKSFGIGTSR